MSMMVPGSVPVNFSSATPMTAKNAIAEMEGFCR